jgi:putative Mg2+ transporter-C (MgtC) family protein
MHFDLASLGDPALRLAAALLLGCAIGFERQWNQKMAGLRTNALVALGASGFVVFSGLVGEGDPTRIAAQVVTGIGFLGAGVILREGINVLVSTRPRRCGARPWSGRWPVRDCLAPVCSRPAL